MDRRNPKRRSVDVGIATILFGWKQSARMAFVASTAGGRERRRVVVGAHSRVAILRSVPEVIAISHGNVAASLIDDQKSPGRS